MTGWSPDVQLQRNPGGSIGHRCPEDSVDRGQDSFRISAGRRTERSDLHGQSDRFCNLNCGQNMGSRIALNKGFDRELGDHLHRDIMPQIRPAVKRPLKP